MPDPCLGGAWQAERSRKSKRKRSAFISIEPIGDRGQTLNYPRGKVLGILDTQGQFDDVVAALKNAGFAEITALHGEDGVQLLSESTCSSLATSRILERHIRELKEGHFIIAVQTPPDQAQQVAQVAAEHGARRLVHFGFLTGSWLK